MVIYLNRIINFLDCLLIKVRSYYLINLKFVLMSLKLFYEILSPISTIGINFLHGIVFLIIFLIKNLVNLIYYFL